VVPKDDAARGPHNCSQKEMPIENEIILFGPF